MRLILCPTGTPDDNLWPGLLARLDEAERARASRFVFPRDRWSYAVAHVLLRHALDQVAVPQAWQFTADAFGKPRLLPACGDLRFSLSHTDGMVAVALAWGQEVGVDVEPAGRIVDELAVLQFALAPLELEELDRAPDRAGRLLHLWVLKEAVAKAIGRGLSLPFTEIAFQGDPPTLHALPEAWGTPIAWWVESGLHGSHMVAVAAAQAPSRLDRIETTVAALVG